MIDAYSAAARATTEEQQHPCQQTMARSEVGDNLSLWKVRVNMRRDLPALVELLARQYAELANNKCGVEKETRWMSIDESIGMMRAQFCASAHLGRSKVGRGAADESRGDWSGDHPQRR